MRSGQRSYIPGIGYIRINLVEEVELDQLTDADAIPDGFPSAEALRKELNEFYAEKIAAGYKAFRVVFRLMREGEEG